MAFRSQLGATASKTLLGSTSIAIKPSAVAVATTPAMPKASIPVSISPVSVARAPTAINVAAPVLQPAFDPTALLAQHKKGGLGSGSAAAPGTADATVSPQPGPTPIDAPQAQEDKPYQQTDEPPRAPSPESEDAAADNDAPREDSAADEEAITEEATEETPSEEVADVTYEGDAYTPFAASHIGNCCLNTVAVSRSEFGWEVLTSRVRLPVGPHKKTVPVEFGAETDSPTLNEAMRASMSIVERKANSGKQKAMAGSLVERARAGDQNAMAIIALVRDNARAGNERAQFSFGCIRQYIDENPVDATMHGDGEHRKPKNWAHVWVANSHQATNPGITQMAAEFGEDAPAFFAGVRHGMKYYHNRQHEEPEVHPTRQGPYEIGVMFGRARALQHARNPRVPLKAHSPQVGWELGE